MMDLSFDEFKNAMNRHPLMTRLKIATARLDKIYSATIESGSGPNLKRAKMLRPILNECQGLSYLLFNEFVDQVKLPDDYSVEARSSYVSGMIKFISQNNLPMAAELDET